MENKRTLTMNWDGLGEDDDDAQFLESYDRLSSALLTDLASSSSSDDDDFDDNRVSFASAVSSITSANFRTSSVASPDYDMWISTPGSIDERRKRLLRGMGLDNKKDSFSSKKLVSKGSPSRLPSSMNSCPSEEQKTGLPSNPNSLSPLSSPSKLPVALVRSRSEGDIDTISISRQRKEELIGGRSKQRLTRTYSMILAPHARVVPPYMDSLRTWPKEGGLAIPAAHSNRHSGTPPMSQFGAFFLIKNLDTGREFIVREYGKDGMWNRLSDLQTGKKLTMEEFEQCVGYSALVKELMRRENVSSRPMNDVDGSAIDRKVSANSYFSRSLRMSKKGGAALLKNVRGLANSMGGVLIGEKEVSQLPSLSSDQKPGKSSSGWVKVRQSGKSHKELSALHFCQEIQAHEGSIWTIKFSQDARFLASGGEDRVIHVWEVQECEVVSLRTGEEGWAMTQSVTHYNPSSCAASPDNRPHPPLGDVVPLPSEKRRRSKSSNRRGNLIPDYVHVPETVFSLSETPLCSFEGHLGDVLDLSWSKSQLLLSSSMDKTVRLWDLESRSCLKMFKHSDYVTCIQFNPVDDNYFISGSLDAKVRIWSVHDRQVVDWIDFHELVTAASYTPDGQGAIIGSHKGSIRTYSTADCKFDQISQIVIQTKRKSHSKKITGFQFAPGNPSEVLVTSADSRIRILAGSDVSHKFKGFRNTSSQIAASFSRDGRHIISASEDSHVYIWRRGEPRNAGTGKAKSLVTTQSQEHFQCRDVSVAIPWPGTIKGEPPATRAQSKRHSRRFSPLPSTNVSPSGEENSTQSKRHFPPLPKKNANYLESASTPQEEELGLISRTDFGLGESFNSLSAWVRLGDSPAPSAAIVPSSSPSPSWTFSDSNQMSHTIQPTAWGLVIVTAGLGGEIKAYQNFGIPRRIGRQTSLFGGAA